jgi:hypothetical protein
MLKYYQNRSTEMIKLMIKFTTFVLIVAFITHATIVITFAKPPKVKPRKAKASVRANIVPGCSASAQIQATSALPSPPGSTVPSSINTFYTLSCSSGGTNFCQMFLMESLNIITGDDGNPTTNIWENPSNVTLSCGQGGGYIYQGSQLNPLPAGSYIYYVGIYGGSPDNVGSQIAYISTIIQVPGDVE